MRVILIDHRAGGHHPTYLAKFIEALHGLGCELAAYTPEPEAVLRLCRLTGVESWIHRFEPPRPSPHRFPKWVRIRDSYLRRWLAVARAIRLAERRWKTPPDLVFLCWLDDLLARPRMSAWNHLIDRLIRVPWSGLFFHPTALRPGLGRSQPSISTMPWRRLQSRHLHGLALLDESLAPWFEDALPGQRIVVFPDVADDRPPDLDFPLLSTISERARGRRIVSLLGSIEKRKGVATFLEMAEGMRNEPYFFVLAGELACTTFTPAELDQLLRSVSAPPENVLIELGSIPDGPPFNGLVARSDFLWAVYDDFRHSANVLTKAAAFARPVIVADGFLMAERARNFHLGPVVSANGPESIAAAIREWDARTGDEEARGRSEYLALQSVGRLRECFTHLLSSAPTENQE